MNPPTEKLTKFKATILTAIEPEYLAVCKHLTGLVEHRNELGSIYEVGFFIEGNRELEVMIGQIGAGNANAAAEVERAVEFFKSLFEKCIKRR